MIHFSNSSSHIMSKLRSLAAAFVISLALVRPAAAVDWTDIWWNPNESGWGVNFIQSSNFIFATFFIYGTAGSPQQQPFWVTAQLTVDSNGVWSGPLYQTTGTFFGVPWNPALQTTTQVGTATFTPTNSYSGTLTYNIGATAVAKQIQRQTLRTTPMGGSYSGTVESFFANCNDPSLNGPASYFANVIVTQNSNGTLQLAFTTNGGNLSLSGPFIQNGLLYRMDNATYTNSAYSATAFTVTAQVSEIKPTAQGLEGKWTAPVGAVFPGCVETAFFSLLFL
jgi:hypothetical protein